MARRLRDNRGGGSLVTRLAGLERRLDALEAEESLRPSRPERSDEGILEISLILLEYGHRGNTEAFAEYLAGNDGLPLEKAREIAAWIGCLLEERRAAGHRI